MTRDLCESLEVFKVRIGLETTELQTRATCRFFSETWTVFWRLLPRRARRRVPVFVHNGREVSSGVCVGRGRATLVWRAHAPAMRDLARRCVVWARAALRAFEIRPIGIEGVLASNLNAESRRVSRLWTISRAPTTASSRDRGSLSERSPSSRRLETLEPEICSNLAKTD